MAAYQVRKPFEAADLTALGFSLQPHTARNITMPPDTGKLDAALRENMKKRKAQMLAQVQAKAAHSKTASPVSQEPLEPPAKPA
jgi:hypothetical protein